MKENEEYKKHIEESWHYANSAVNNLADDEKTRNELALMVFEKMCSPYHYFQQNETNNEPSPTERQINFAKKLGITKPEKMTKQQLSDEINKKMKK